jgi:hypothetical protein
MCTCAAHDEKSLHDATEPGGMHDNFVGAGGRGEKAELGKYDFA